MIIVIADDITGAAEIGGIGVSFGMNTELCIQLPEKAIECDLLVIATDTRSMTERHSIEILEKILRQIRNIQKSPEIFKKTDSALRGHIFEEIDTILKHSHYNKAILLPQNPSKGRTIENGIYKINGIPLNETAFAYDPEYPAVSSDVHHIIKANNNINLKDASTRDDVKSALIEKDQNTLLAGAADLFTEYITSLGFNKEKTKHRTTVPNNDGVIIICGSTQSKSLDKEKFIVDNSIPIVNMTEESLFSNNTSAWHQQLMEAYQNKGSVVMTVGRIIDQGKTFANALKIKMAEACCKLFEKQIPSELIIEGGATAYTIIRALHLQTFEIEQEIAPGVIRMKCTLGHSTLHVVLKPGSYSWASLF